MIERYVPESVAMRAAAIAAAGGLALTLLSGCSGPETPGNLPVEPSIAAQASTTPGAETAPTASTDPTVEDLKADPALLATAYTSLPAAVMEGSKAAVQISSDIKPTEDTYNQFGQITTSLDYTAPEGSGSVIRFSANGQTTEAILTAGHVVGDPSIKECGDNSAYYDLFNDRALVSRVKQEAFYDVTGKPDAAILIPGAPAADVTLDQMPSVQLGDSTNMPVGTPLWFANFQPRADGSDRYTVTDGPAIYDGVDIGTTDNGLIAVDMSGIGYNDKGRADPNAQKFAIGGASGGEVLNEQGLEIGEIVVGSFAGRGQDLLNQVGLQNVRVAHGDFVSLVQPISNEIATDLLNKATTSADCKSTPHIRKVVKQ